MNVASDYQMWKANQISFELKQGDQLKLRFAKECLVKSVCAVISI